MATMSEKDRFPTSHGDHGNSESWLIENSPQRKANIEKECDETSLIDRINQLFDALIVQILSRFRLDSSMVHKFIFLTDNVLPLLSSSSIKKCNLNFVFKHEDDVSYFPIIDKWLEFALNKKVEALCLNISYDIDAIENDQPNSLPEVFCSSSSILKLKCQNCRILDDCVLNWTSLKSLTLESLLIQDEHIRQIMPNCSQLELLNPYGFCGFNHLHTTSPKCKRLKLIDHYHPIGERYSFEGDCCFEVVALYVEDLTISGDFDHTEIELKDLSSLDHAKLDLCSDEFDSVDEDILIDLLVNVRCANEIILSSYLPHSSVQVISNLMLEEEDVSLPLLECRWLTISSCISKLSFPLLENLLRSTHNLENLIIFPDTSYHPFFEDEEIDLLEDKYLSFEEKIFKVSLQNLKNIKVMPFCSRTRRSDETELDQFLKFLLEHAINQEKLIIVPEHKECNSCSTNTSYLMKYLLAFPTTSISAVISLGKVSQNVVYSDV
ncbi:hypothetical protein R3W88_004324 [Solanum pinnatisectum]|uniref:F-box/LRR-repeat protein 15/At3g58940/PEG3-like LRR domain-containing protein n=1 Tax=Solanum pinnatisectum TaxID=50273 RepID=A0AAV9K8Y2_9SOLN|nr:hypothetical protein R3W88_004324 [Solanum pinnatisectum]